MKISTKAIVLAVAATGAQAEGINYMSGQLSYDSVTFGSGLNISNLSIQGNLEYQMGNFTLFGHADSLQLTSTGSTPESQSAYGVDIGYNITPNAFAYIGASQVNSSSRPMNLYHAGAQLDLGSGSLAVDYTADETGRIRLTSFAGEYKASDKFTVGLKRTMLLNSSRPTSYTVAFAEYRDGPLSIDATAIANAGIRSRSQPTSMADLSASYEFGGKYRALAHLSRVVVSGGRVGLSRYSVGAGYQVMDGLWLDAKVGQVERIFGGRSLTTASVSLTYETGRQTRLIDRVRSHEYQTMLSSAVATSSRQSSPFVPSGLNPGLMSF